MLTAILSEGKKAEDVEKSLLAEIKKLQDAPVSAAELEKAKNQLITNQLRQRETSNGKALALGEAAVLLGRSGTRQYGSRAIAGSDGGRHSARDEEVFHG